jgi:small subunit ribosomal protein S20
VANHKSAVKRHRQSLDKATRNRAAKSRVKNAFKEVRTAIGRKDRDKACSALSAAASVLGKAARKGTLHRRRAARKMSRLACAVNAIKAG